MHESFQKAKEKPAGRWRGGAALCLSLLLAFPLLCSNASAESAVRADTASAASASELVPVGHTVGIKLFARGILVVKLSDGRTPASAAGMEPGDIILKCDGTAVTSTEQFQSLLQKAGGKTVELSVRRGAAVRTLRVTPEKNGEGVWGIGAWVRDSMAGIGTMTFYDPKTGVFGALGHGITDVDTAQLMPFSSGSILPATVKAVKRGEAGSAGELRGNFDLETDLGELYANTDGGIFGTLADAGIASGRAALPVAENAEVKTGKAVILANVSGDEVREYEIEITKIFDDSDDSRNLLITVTDPALLRETGGIVQGMSGSPILQDGKLVGAVTHVLLSDPTRGYGILIRNMLASADAQAVENVS
jgi:stage IV sporulation protein B